MKKIISLYQRNYETDRLVRDEVVPGAEWVLAGEGRPTRKWDGTCCMVRNGVLFRRYEVKKGKQPPMGFEPASEVDLKTGKQQGWVAIDMECKADQWHAEAWRNHHEDNDRTLPPGSYELVGPKVQGNPDGFDRHTLVPHGAAGIDGDPRSFLLIREFLTNSNIEGIVWHRDDGQMVKIKAKDFGIKREKSCKT